MEKNNKFGGFDAVIDTFLPADGNENFMNPEDIEKEMQKLDTIAIDDDSNSSDKDDLKKTSKSSSDDTDDISLNKDIDDKSDDDKKDDSDNDDISIDDKLDIEDVEESDLVTAFSDLFAEELGWEYDDEEKPKSMKELVSFMQNVINENSTPKYANDEVKDLDEFVRNGGDIRDYYKTTYSSEINIDKLDLTKESNQKAVVRENLINRGYSESRIEKLISRYEETGTLEDEATDSITEVKEFREKAKAQLLDSQKKFQEQQEKEQRDFVTNVKKVIDESTDIRGLELSSKDKQEVFDYIFKPDRDGLTRYQKEYNSNLKNLVESAYFTMKGDKLVQQIQTKAKTTAAKDIITKLKTKGKSTKNTVSDQDEGSKKITQLWEIAGKELRNF